MTKITTVMLTKVKIFVKMADDRIPNPKRTRILFQVFVYSALIYITERLIPARAKVMAMQKKST